MVEISVLLKTNELQYKPAEEGKMLWNSKEGRQRMREELTKGLLVYNPGREMLVRFLCNGWIHCDNAGCNCGPCPHCGKLKKDLTEEEIRGVLIAGIIHLKDAAIDWTYSRAYPGVYPI